MGRGGGVSFLNPIAPQLGLQLTEPGLREVSADLTNVPKSRSHGRKGSSFFLVPLFKLPV